MAATRNSRPTEPVAAVAACLAPRLSAGARVCVALSGGRDSVALLLALVELRAGGLPGLDLSALHVHHGLSAQADAWADFCAALCRAQGVAFRCVRVTVARNAAEGLEAAARRARYAAFADCAADWLLLAHHRDDQAETLLLNLLRGAGLHGLAAMPEARALAGGPALLRPWLQVPRAQIEAWLAARGQDWIDDDSNADTRLRRNFLRLRALPLLAEQFPEPSVSLARTAAHLAEMSTLADEVATADAAAAVADEVLLLTPFNALPPARRANLLRFFLRRCGLRMPDSRYLAEMLRQLAEAAASAAPSFAVDGLRLQVARGRLGPSPDRPSAPPVATPWGGDTVQDWAGGRILCRPVVGEGIAGRALAGPAEFRPRQGGEALRPDARRPRRPLKKLLQESGLPPWQRERLPLLWCGETLLWVAGVGYATDAGALAEPGEPGWLLSWEAPPRFSDG